MAAAIKVVPEIVEIIVETVTHKIKTAIIPIAEIIDTIKTEPVI